MLLDDLFPRRMGIKVITYAETQRRQAVGLKGIYSVDTTLQSRAVDGCRRGRSTTGGEERCQDFLVTSKTTESNATLRTS